MAISGCGGAGADLRQFVGFNAGIGAAAADHDVCRGHGRAEGVGVERRAAAGGDEPFGTAGRGEDRHVGAAAFAQQCHGGAGVRAGAENDNLLGGPVRILGEVGCEVQGYGHDGQAPRAECGLRAHVLGGLGGGLEEPDQPGAGGAFMLGRDQGAAHLAGDFAFTHDGGVESGAHGKEVPGHFGAGPWC